MSHLDLPFFQGVSTVARRSRLATWDPQALANLSWAYATIMLLDEPLMQAISLRAVEVISEFAPQNLSNSRWR